MKSLWNQGPKRLSVFRKYGQWNSNCSFNDRFEKIFFGQLYLKSRLTNRWFLHKHSCKTQSYIALEKTRNYDFLLQKNEFFRHSTLYLVSFQARHILYFSKCIYLLSIYWDCLDSCALVLFTASEWSEASGKRFFPAVLLQLPLCDFPRKNFKAYKRQHFPTTLFLVRRLNCSAYDFQLRQFKGTYIAKNRTNFAFHFAQRPWIDSVISVTVKKVQKISTNVVCSMWWSWIFPPEPSQFFSPVFGIYAKDFARLFFSMQSENNKWSGCFVVFRVLTINSKYPFIRIFSSNEANAKVPDRTKFPE